MEFSYMLNFKMVVCNSMAKSILSQNIVLLYNQAILRHTVQYVTKTKASYVSY